VIKFDPGQIIRFTYQHPAEGVDEDTGERYKEVLVLHPNWHHKVHAIDLKRLTEAERDVLYAILDEKQVAAAKAGKKPHRFPLVNDILRRMDPLEEIKNPVGFYNRFVKVFLKNKDAYRTYFPVRMSAVTIVQKSDVRGKVINPKPLFHKVETKPTAPTPPKQPTAPQQPKAGQSRLDLIRQRAQAAKKPQ
jgi:hypothetical protein